MEDINENCLEVIYHLGVTKNSFDFEFLSEKISKKVQKSQIIVEKYLEENNLKNCIKKENYYLLLYCVIFKEELVNNDILDILVDNYENKLSPFFDILRMNSKLNDEIVSKIINIINEMCDCFKRCTYLGYLPFDYRYHILKREEISYEIKKKILDTYGTDIEFIRDEIYNDLDNKVSNEGLPFLMLDYLDVFFETYPELKDQKRVLEIIDNYKEQKRKKYE